MIVTTGVMTSNSKGHQNMRFWALIRAMLLTITVSFTALLAPLAASAQDATAEPAYDYADITFVNPSVVEDSLATPAAATPATGETERHGPMLGDPDAPVTLQIYADYQCPHCRAFHRDIEPLLVEDYVRTGKIRLEFKDFPVIGIKSLQELTDDTKESVQAAEAAMCAAEQDAYMPYREALYAGDLDPNSGALSDENLIAVADDLDLDTAALADCLESGRYEEAIVAGSMAAVEMGVQGTPTMAINGEIVQVTDGGYDGLKTILDDAIEQAG
jgi:protein-disulfide isomerase